MKPFNKRDYKTFELFNKDWALVTAGPMDDYNTMVIGWEEMGTALCDHRRDYRYRRRYGITQQ